MATQSNKSKAKTKTTKKAVKSTKATKAKSSAAKASVKTTAEKTPVTKKTTVKAASATTKTRRGKAVTMARLRGLQLFSAGVFGLLAVFAGTVMTTAAYTLSVGYLTKDELASRTSTVFAPGSQAVWDVEVRWALIVSLGILALLSLLFAARLRNRYQAQVESGVSTLRWLSIGVMLVLFTEIIAVLSGMQDIVLIKLTGGLMALYAVLAWLTERRHAAKLSSKASYIAAAVSGLLPLIAIAVYAVNTHVYGEVRYAWYVYALQATLALGLFKFANNQRRQITLKKNWAENYIVERSYISAQLLLAIVFAGVVLVGFQQ